MRIVILFLLLFFAKNIQAQVGFSKGYKFDSLAAGFSNMLIDNDTVVVIGVIRTKNTPYPQAILFAKLDTFGNVLMKKEFIHPDKEDYIIQNGNSFIKTDDGGYMVFGTNYKDDITQFIFKLKKNDEIDFFKNYENNTYIYSKGKNLIQLPDGYLFSSFVFLNNISYLNVKKIDLKGNLKWDKTYTLSDCTYNINAAYIHANQYLIVANKADCVEATKSSKLQLRHIYIDSLGNITKMNETPPNIFYYKTKIKFKNIDEWYRYGSLFIPLKDGKYPRTFVEKMYKDSVVWRNASKEDTLKGGIHNDMIFSKDKKIICTGAYYLYYDTTITFLQPKPSYRAGGLFKFNIDGAKIWHRYDTLYFGHEQVAYNELYGLGELSSGSIIAIGEVTNNFALPGMPFIEPWLIKVDKNGCINKKDCAKIVSLKELFDTAYSDNLTIFPNPTQSQVTIKIDNNTIKNIDLYDINARRLQVHDYETPLSKAILTLPESSDTHLFLLKIKMSDGSTAIRKVMKI